MNKKTMSDKNNVFGAVLVTNRLIIAFLLVVIILVTIPLVREKPLSGEEVFAKAVSNVVEVKAQNDADFCSYGTAVLLGGEGEFITNAHVVTYTALGAPHEFSQYFIRFAFEDDYREVALVRYDTVLDLAVLKIIEKPAFELKPVELGVSAKIKSGNAVYAVGNAMNYGITIAAGIVGVPLVKIEYESAVKEVIQCDLTIAEGNSGGALFDNFGRLIGITTFRTKDAKGNPVYGIAYCIPIDRAAEFFWDNRVPEFDANFDANDE